MHYGMHRHPLLIRLKPAGFLRRNADATPPRPKATRTAARSDAVEFGQWPLASLEGWYLAAETLKHLPDLQGDHAAADDQQRAWHARKD